jgi:hypothetical protein
MQTSSHVKEIRQCGCEQCRLVRSYGKSVSKWKKIRQDYRQEMHKKINGGDLEEYNIHQTTRDYDA